MQICFHILVHIALSLYQNLSSLLSPQDSRSRLVSSVILSTVKCELYPCIDQSYTITFKLYVSDTLKVIPVNLVQLIEHVCTVCAFF